MTSPTTSSEGSTKRTTTTTAVKNLITATSTTRNDGRFELPHWNTGDSVGAVTQSDVTLVGDEQLGCVWLEFHGGKHAAIWPPGTTATFGPVKVYDANGNVEWIEGEARSFGGSPDAQGDTSAVPSQCRTSASVAVVTEVN